MLRYIQQGIFIPDTPTDIANLGTYKNHIVDLPTLIQSYINQGLVTTSSSGWSLTGNSGTDDSVNFVGTTDEQALVLGSNSTPLFRLGINELSITGRNVYNPFTDDGFLIQANLDEIINKVYNKYGDDLIKTRIFTEGYEINRVDNSSVNHSSFFINRVSGNIGINTNSPTSPFHVAGNTLIKDNTINLTVEGAKESYIDHIVDVSEGQYNYSGFRSYGDDCHLKMGVTGTDWGDVWYSLPYLNNTSYIQSYYTDLVLDSISNPIGKEGRIILSVERNPVMEIKKGVTINPDYNNVVSTTTPNLQINQVMNDSGYGMKFVSAANALDNWEVYFGDTASLYLSYKESLVGTFDNTSGVYTSVSDERLKQNIVPLVDEALLLQLEPKQFTFKSDSANKKRYGLIAQEVKQIIPEIVLGDEENGTLTVDYASLIPLLIKQIKTLTAQVNSLIK